VLGRITDGNSLANHLYALTPRDTDGLAIRFMGGQVVRLRDARKEGGA
jgi:hypothetical protein